MLFADVEVRNVRRKKFEKLAELNLIVNYTANWSGQGRDFRTTYSLFPIPTVPYITIIYT